MENTLLVVSLGVVASLIMERVPEGECAELSWELPGTALRAYTNKEAILTTGKVFSKWSNFTDLTVVIHPSNLDSD